MSSEELMKSKFLAKMTEVSIKLGNQVHVQSMRDAFVVMMPLFIAAGLAVMINVVIFPIFASGEVLAWLQRFGSAMVNGSLNVSALMISLLIGYNLARNKSFNNPLAAGIVALASFLMSMPISLEHPMEGGSLSLSGYIAYSNLGPAGMITAVIIGLLSCEIFLALSKSKYLKINLGSQVPSGVARSFEALLPILFTTSTLVIASLLLEFFTQRSLTDLILLLIQTPLRAVSNSLFGYMFLSGLAALLFSLGIHSDVINQPFIDPIMTVNMAENTLAFMNGTPIPHILTSAFRNTFMAMGGQGSTVSLLIAAFLMKDKQSRTLAKLSFAPGLFNINEPIIFGYPIIYNLPLMIPFVALPVLGGLLGYYATALGLVAKTVIAVPWTTPPIISGYLATAGDVRTAILQAIILIIGVAIYLPFMKISQRIVQKSAQSDREEL
jgi:cellobiose PTS system EIIC component